MELIEQAIFTSAETDRGSGYQLAAASPGLNEVNARELIAWGPSHDSLADSSPQAASLNFHPLPSGAHCVSRTTPSGFEYSGRGGVRVYTQCLVAPPGVLARFANNPFALWKAAAALGAVRQYENVPARLEPLRLAGRAAAVDPLLLARLCVCPGPEWMAAIIQAALDSVSVAMAGGPPADQLIAGLISCLPVECRPDFSFSTGLKFSSRRPFRIVALAAEREEQRRIERLYNVAVLRLDEPPPAEFAPVEAWPRFIHRALKSGRTSFLVARLAQRHFGFTLQDLSALGLQLLEELDASSLQEGGPGDSPPVEPDAEPEQEDAPPESQGEPKSPRPGRQRAHAAHRPSQSPAPIPSLPARPAERPSQRLDPSDPAVQRKLERLDDVVFDAITGEAQALGQFKTLWPQIRGELSEPLLAESREQYLRYALAIWSDLKVPDGSRDTHRAAQSLEVLALLFEQA